jgi:hypothetical protein
MKCVVKGVTFKNDNYPIDRQKIIAGLYGKEIIYLKREPDNRFDNNAVAVMLKREKKDFKLGYVRRELAAFLADTWKEYKYSAKIVEIRDGSLAEGRPYGLSIDITKRSRPRYQTNRKTKTR